MIEILFAAGFLLVIAASLFAIVLWPHVFVVVGIVVGVPAMLFMLGSGALHPGRDVSTPVAACALGGMLIAFAAMFALEGND